MADHVTLKQYLWSNGHGRDTRTRTSDIREMMDRYGCSYTEAANAWEAVFQANDGT